MRHKGHRIDTRGCRTGRRRRKRLPVGNGGWSTTAGYEGSCRKKGEGEGSAATDRLMGKDLRNGELPVCCLGTGSPPSSKNQVRWDSDQPDRTLRQKGPGAGRGGCSCAVGAQPELCVGSEPKPKRAPSRHRWRLHVSQSGWCFANPASLCCAKKSRQLNSACSSMGNPVEIRAISPLASCHYPPRRKKTLRNLGGAGPPIRRARVLACHEHSKVVPTAVGMATLLLGWYCRLILTRLTSRATAERPSLMRCILELHHG